MFRIVTLELCVGSTCGVTVVFVTVVWTVKLTVTVEGAPDAAAIFTPEIGQFKFVKFWKI